MRSVHISVAAFAPVYQRVFEISIFHFRVARYSCWTVTTERVGICNTHFADETCFVRILFSSLTYITLVYSRFQRHHRRLVSSQSYWAGNACPSLNLLYSKDITKDIASTNYDSIVFWSVIKYAKIAPKFYR